MLSSTKALLFLLIPPIGIGLLSDEEAGARTRWILMGSALAAFLIPAVFVPTAIGAIYAQLIGSGMLFTFSLAEADAPASRQPLLVSLEIALLSLASVFLALQVSLLLAPMLAKRNCETDRVLAISAILLFLGFSVTGLKLWNHGTFISKELKASKKIGTLPILFIAVILALISGMIVIMTNINLSQFAQCISH